MKFPVVHYYDIIRINIKKYRKLAGLTQEQLAEKINLHATTIGKIESMKMHRGLELDTLILI